LGIFFCELTLIGHTNFSARNVQVVRLPLFEQVQKVARRSSVADDTFSHELLHAFRSVRFHAGDWEPQLDIIRDAGMLIENVG
jgi:hypothetical protein